MCEQAVGKSINTESDMYWHCSDDILLALPFSSYVVVFIISVFVVVVVCFAAATAVVAKNTYDNRLKVLYSESKGIFK